MLFYDLPVLAICLKVCIVMIFIQNLKYYVLLCICATFQLKSVEFTSFFPVFGKIQIERMEE